MIHDWEIPYYHQLFLAAKQYRENMNPEEDSRLHDNLLDATAAITEAVDGPRERE